MLDKKALEALKKKLPKDGIQKVAERSGVSYESVKKILNTPERFNKDVIEAALEIVEDYQAQLTMLEDRAAKLLGS